MEEIITLLDKIIKEKHEYIEMLEELSAQTRQEMWPLEQQSLEAWEQA